jgi:outer membrane protein assembly factor BamA
VILLGAAVPASAACESHDYRTDKNRGVIVEEVNFNSQTLTSSELLPLKTYLLGSCFDDSNQQLGDRIRYQLQQQGYYLAKIDNVEIKPGDSLAIPKRVALSADIVPGNRARLTQLTFSGERAFTSEQLAAQFPIKLKDTLDISKISSGLGSLRKMYGAAGYLDFTPVPETQIRADGGVALTIEIDEGKLYRLAKVEILGDSRDAAILNTHWQLQPGQPFDSGYVRRFLDENNALLPDTFSSTRGVQVARNCPDASVQVRIVVDGNKNLSPLTDTPCEKSSDSK